MPAPEPPVFDGTKRDWLAVGRFDMAAGDKGYVCAVTAIRETAARAMTFLIEIEQPDQPPPRPRYVCVEIQPQQDTGSPAGPRQTFFDGELVPREGRTLLQFHASPWPQGVSRAEIRVWICFQSLGDWIWRQPLSELDRPQTFNSPRRPRTSLNVSRSEKPGGDVEIIVEERRQGPDPSVLRLRLEAGGKSHRAVHKSLGLHTFEVSAAAAQSPLVLETIFADELKARSVAAPAMKVTIP